MTPDQVDQLLSLLSRFVVSQESLLRVLDENRVAHIRVAAAQESSARVCAQRWEHEVSVHAAWEANNKVVAEANLQKSAELSGGHGSRAARRLS